MGIFDTSDVSQQGGTNVSPTQDAVADNSGLIQGIGQLGRGALDFMSKSSEIEQAEKTASLRKGFADRISAINDSVTMKGGLSQAQAARAKNKVITDALASGVDPSVFNLIKSSLGDSAAMEDPETVLEDNLIKVATDRGSILPGMDRATQISLGRNAQREIQLETQMASDQKALTLESGQNQFQGTLRKQEATKQMSEYAQVKLDGVQKKMGFLMQGIKDAGGDTAAKGVAVAEMEKYKAEVLRGITSFSGADRAQAEAFTTAINYQIDLASSFANDKISTEVYEARSKNLVAIEKTKALGITDIKKLHVISSLVRTMVLSPHISTSAVDYIGPAQKSAKGSGKPIDVFHSDADDQTEANSYLQYNLDVGDKVIKTLHQQTPEETTAHRDYLTDQANALFKSIDMHGSESVKPKEWAPAIQALLDPRYIASREFLGNSGLDAESLAGASAALRAYGGLALNSVKTNFDTAELGDGLLKDSVTMKIEPHPTAIGMTVTLTPNREMNNTERKAVARAQRGFGRVVANLVTAGAHLQGSRDYTGYFEKNYGRLFGQDIADKRKVNEAK